jgi:hypothetical protein
VREWVRERGWMLSCWGEEEHTFLTGFASGSKEPVEMCFSTVSKDSEIFFARSGGERFFFPNIFCRRERKKRNKKEKKRRRGGKKGLIWGWE